MLNKTSRERITYSSLFFGLVVLVCLSFSGIALPSTLVVGVQGSEIDIRADQVPLIDILKALSEKTGISLTTGDPLKDSVSFHFKERSMERCLQRLLAKRNYIILFDKTGDDRFVAKGVQVFGDQGQKVLGMGNDIPQPADPMKTLTRDWFNQAFGDPKHLSGQISADLTGDGVGGKGIRVTKVLMNSSFKRIGIEKDDTIYDVNGKPVRNVKDLIDALHEVTEGQPMIRIERVGKDNMMKPIYIHLQ